ncbi:MAG: MFS transporter [Bifidobacterium psychraerophilum]|uniref:MFS transporter n=1 Tax=Bifidobacterium psychraerophilum TaxID=218140 RepID=UPI0039E80701
MKKLVTLSFLVMFLIGTDTFLVSPLLPALSSRMSFPLARGGWLVSAYAIGYCIAALVIGPLSDRMNRRTVLITGLLLFSLATSACALATGFWMLLALRLLTGVCAAIGSPQIWAIIPQIVPKKRIAAVMSAPTAGLTIATMLGVPIGSFLSVRSSSTPFLVVGGISLLVTAALMLLFPAVPSLPHMTPTKPAAAASTRHPEEGDGQEGAVASDTVIASLAGSYRRLFGNPRAWRYFLAYLIFQVGNFAVMTFIATWFAEDFGLDQTHIGLAVMVIGIGNSFGAFGGPLLTSRLPHGRLMLLGFGIYLLAYAFLAASPTIVYACGILFLSYMVSGAIFPLFIERLQSLTTTQRGTVSTLSNITMYAGSTIAGFIGGPLMLLLPGFWGISILALIAMTLSLYVWQRSGALTDDTQQPSLARHGDHREDE